jgi:HD-GYP domain-containing protein (c-di-GMP phosphodiesterase class II)
MTSDRAYRDAVPSADALDEIRRCSGTQFDPETARAFCDLVAESPPLPALAA